MKFKHTKVWGFDHAIRGMRNPLESWGRSDSGFITKEDDTKLCFMIGKADMDLMKRLIGGGNEHRKFMRQIMVSVDITAPLYWFKEMDTYSVGVVGNSTSTMHKLASTPITLDCFEKDEDFKVSEWEINGESCCYSLDEMWENIISDCELLRKAFLETKDKKYWRALIQLLPESWLQTRTFTMNYENLFSMVKQRKEHKLTEWSEDFISWVKKEIPYSKELIFDMV